MKTPPSTLTLALRTLTGIAVFATVAARGDGYVNITSDKPLDAGSTNFSLTPGDSNVLAGNWNGQLLRLPNLASMGVAGNIGDVNVVQQSGTSSINFMTTSVLDTRGSIASCTFGSGCWMTLTILAPTGCSSGSACQVVYAKTGSADADCNSLTPLKSVSTTNSFTTTQFSGTATICIKVRDVRGNDTAVTAKMNSLWHKCVCNMGTSTGTQEPDSID